MYSNLPTMCLLLVFWLSGIMVSVWVAKALAKEREAVRNEPKQKKWIASPRYRK